MVFGILTHELFKTVLGCCEGLFPRLFLLEAPVASDMHWCASCTPSLTAFSAQNSLAKVWSSELLRQTVLWSLLFVALPGF